MNISYFRKSLHSLEKTIELVDNELQKSNWVIIGKTRLGHYKGIMFLISYPEVIDTVIAENHQLLGLLPVSLIVYERGNDVLVGSGNASLLKAIGKTSRISALSESIQNELKTIIHTSAGLGDVKPGKVILYSTHTCPYCKMEKEWLESKAVEHEVVYVDDNREKAEHIVQKTGQMGVPVTEIQYENADSEFVIGFDKNRLAELVEVAE